VLSTMFCQVRAMGVSSRTKLPSSLVCMSTATWGQQMGRLNPTEQMSEVDSVLRSGMAINTNLRDHSMARKEGSPILHLLLVRVGHNVRTIMLGVAGGVSQRIISPKTLLRVGKPSRLHVTTT